LSGDPRGALQLALRSKAIADITDDPMKAALAEAELGISYFVVGNQADARRYCEGAVARAQAMTTDHSGHFESDVFVQSRCALASSLCLQGFPDKGAALAQQIIEQLDVTEDFLLISNSLLWIIPIFLWRGDWSIAEQLINRLINNAQEHGLSMIENIGGGLRGELLIGRGDIKAGIPLIQRCLEAQPLRVFQISGILTLSSALSAEGDFEGALRTLNQVLPEGDQPWGSQMIAEILRIKGHILAHSPEIDPGCAEHWLLKAVEVSRLHSASSWELRAVTDLAALWKTRGRHDEARAALASVYGRFTEGFGTHDLIVAKRLLDELA
jgi:tetratricopeptide (TPR) repeat protein